jgi:thiamine pyrophosphate-dependent acetolactate synthase large subunit-like protein
MKSARANRASQLETTVREGVKANKPLLIHVPVGPMPDPWKFINMPRVH